MLGLEVWKLSIQLNFLPTCSEKNDAFINYLRVAQLVYQLFFTFFPPFVVTVERLCLAGICFFFPLLFIALQFHSFIPV